MPATFSAATLATAVAAAATTAAVATGGAAAAVLALAKVVAIGPDDRFSLHNNPTCLLCFPLVVFRWHLPWHLLQTRPQGRPFVRVDEVDEAERHNLATFGSYKSTVKFTTPLSRCRA